MTVLVAVKVTEAITVGIDAVVAFILWRARQRTAVPIVTVIPAVRYRDVSIAIGIEVVVTLAVRVDAVVPGLLRVRMGAARAVIAVADADGANRTRKA